jgi:MFS family permease
MSIRGLVAAGLTALTLGLLLLSATSAAWQVVSIYAAFMSLAMVFAGNLPSQILAARWFPEKRGFAMGLASTGFPIGGMLLPPLVAWMLLALGWRQTFVLFAIFCMAAVVPLVLAVVRNEPPAGAAARPDLAKAQGPAPDSQEFTVRQILGTRNFWVLALVVIPIMTGLMGFQANLAAYAAERGIATGEAAGLMSLMAFVLLGARFVWGYLADRYEHRLLFGLAAAGSATAYLAFAFAHGVAGVGATMMLLGLSAGGLLPLMGASLSYQFRRSLGRATGLMALFMPISSFGAPAVARVEEALGSYAPALMALSAFLALAVAAALFLKTQRA